MGWGGIALLGLLLEGMEDVDDVTELDRVDRTVGVTVMVFHDFQHACAAEAFQRLGIRVFATRLSQIERMTDFTDGVFREGKKIVSCAANPAASSMACH